MAAKKARSKKKAKKVAKKKVRKVKSRKAKKAAKKTTKKKPAKKAKKTAKKKPAKKAKKAKAKKPAKKVAKKVRKAPVIGKVTHYYDRIGVAVVEIMSVLKHGDMIRLKHGAKSFAQKAASMQVNHTPIAVAKQGEEIGLKVDQVTPPGTLITAA